MSKDKMSLWNLAEFSDKFNLVCNKMQARFTKFFQTLLIGYFVKSIQLKINNSRSELVMWLLMGDSQASRNKGLTQFQK